MGKFMDGVRVGVAGTAVVLAGACGPEYEPAECVTVPFAPIETGVANQEVGAPTATPEAGGTPPPATVDPLPIGCGPVGETVTLIPVK